MSSINNLKSVSDAAKRAFGATKSSRDAPAQTRSVLGRISDIAQIVTPILLVLIAALALQTDREVLDQSTSSEAIKRALVLDIERLQQERTSLELEVREAQSEKNQYDYELRLAAAELLKREKEVEILAAQVSERQNEIKAAKAEADKFQSQLYEDRTDWLRTLFMQSTFYKSSDITGTVRKFERKDLVEYGGAPVELPPNLGDYWPPEREEIWSEFVKSARLWRAETVAGDIPEEDKAFVNKIVQSFINECRPKNSKERFVFEQNVPSFETFRTASELFPRSGTTMLADEWDKLETQIEDAREFGALQTEKARTFVKLFNAARAKYLVQIYDDVLLCEYSPAIEIWKNNYTGEEGIKRMARVLGDNGL